MHVRILQQGQSILIQDISSPKPMVSTPAPNTEVFDLWESNEDDVYNLPAEDLVTVQYLSWSRRHQAKEVPQWAFRKEKATLPHEVYSVMKYLQKFKVDVSISELIVASQKHRRLVKAL